MEKVNLFIGETFVTASLEDYRAGLISNPVTEFKLGFRHLVQLKGVNGLLSEYQKRVYDGILAGKSNQEIADKMEIQIKTVKFHVTAIYKILKVKTRGQLMALVIKTVE